MARVHFLPAAILSLGCGTAGGRSGDVEVDTLVVATSGNECGHVFEDGCGLAADLLTVFSPDGRGSSHGAIFYSLNGNETYLVVTSAVLSAPGAVATTVAASDAAISFHASSCSDSCRVDGRTGTIDLVGEVRGCPDTGGYGCMDGTVVFTFNNVTFEDESRLDAATFTATYDVPRAE